MRLKTFTAKTMSEAMKLVRQTLGDEAVIIATKEENGGQSVQVTAAIEQTDTLPDPYPEGYETSSARPNFELDTSTTPKFSNDQPSPEDEWLQYDEEEEFEGQLTEELTDVMLRHVVPNDVMDNILSTASMTGLGNAQSALTAAIDHLFSFVPLPQKSPRKALMLVGPPGAGKTLMIAKMATQAVLNDLSVTVITTDTVRAGGVEQLQAFTKLLKVPLHKAKTREQLNTLLQDAQGHDLVLIDTAGTNPHDPDDMARVARLIDAGSIEPVLALTAGVDADESSEIARSFALLGVQRMVATRLDIARRLGGLLAAAQKGGMTFCDASFTPKVTDGIFQMTPSKLAEFLINPDRALRDTLVNNEDDGQKTPQPRTAGRAK
jgi:flagellar biosynthesis protein FlhF